MKKTLTLLLAAGGIAMGATEIPVEWGYGSGYFPDGAPSNASAPFSVLLQLDLSEMDALSPYGAPLFSWSTSDSSYSDSIYIDIFDGTLSVGLNGTIESGLSLPLEFYSAASGYEQSLLGYTFSEEGVVTLSLINVLTDGTLTEMEQWSTTVTIPAGTELTLGSFYYHQASTTPHQLYSGALSETEMKNALTAIVMPNVPEPTTATLSLLALAGLAARRRRK